MGRQVASKTSPTQPCRLSVRFNYGIEIGGGLPNFLTTPVVIDNIKNMFRIVDRYFSDQNEGGALDQYLKDLQKEALIDNNSLLMTP